MLVVVVKTDAVVLAICVFWAEGPGFRLTLTPATILSTGSLSGVMEYLIKPQPPPTVTELVTWSK